MTQNCMKCLGLIVEPGKAYGYAGKVCSCIEPQTWRPKGNGPLMLGNPLQGYVPPMDPPQLAPGQTREARMLTEADVRRLVMETLINLGLVSTKPQAQGKP